MTREAIIAPLDRLYGGAMWHMNLLDGRDIALTKHDAERVRPFGSDASRATRPFKGEALERTAATAAEIDATLTEAVS